ncbi:MAG: esterase/lipase family protein [Nevskiaceae bacterium]
MKRIVASLGMMLMASNPAMAADCVVLLHGLGRSHLSMALLEFSLENSGYTVWNKGYPSTRDTVEKLAPVVGEAVEACRAQRATKIHFVTHSMGGILVRAYFSDHQVPEAGRVVMLAPPNRGSEIVDAYRDRWWFKWVNGPAGQQLGTAADSLPNTLPPLKLEVGIVAGRRSSDPWFSELYDGDHDGKVSVVSTRLPEMKEQLVVDSGHTFMMNSPEVIRQVKAFLRDGAFQKSRA